MLANVNIQNQPQQVTSNKICLKSLPQNPCQGHKARHGSQAGTHNSIVKQHTPWRYPPEFWDQLSRISLTHTALEEFDRRNEGHNNPYSLLPPTTLAQVITLKGSKELSRFARGGGPCLCDLRGYQLPAGTMASQSFPESQLAQSTNSTNAITQHNKPKVSSAYDSNFGQHLTENNIHPIWKSQEPDLLESIHKVLAAPRPSLLTPEFSAESFQNFKRNNLQAKNERDIIEDVIPIIIGARNTNWPIARDMIFNHLEPLTDGTLPSAKPDFSYGALSGQLNPVISTKLGGFIAPGPDIPLVPNFFLEVKGPNGSAAVKTLQACYDGALGARAMHQLQNYGQEEEPIYDGKSYTFSSTYHDGQLKLYTHHLTAPTTCGGQPEYHMTQLDTWGMTGNIQSFIRGVTAFRNLRDLAKQHRDTFIKDANFREAGYV